MIRRAMYFGACCVVASMFVGAAGLQAAEIRGDYLESRTCDVWTGPCFANSEVGLAGQTAVMAWSIEQGNHKGTDLTGLKVVLALRANNTLAVGGGMSVIPEPIRSVILVDERATADQRLALADFAREHAGRYAGTVARIDAVPIDMQLDHVSMSAKLQAGREVKMTTRKLTLADACCTNEEIYYPPLAKVENYEAAMTVDGGFNGRGLGIRWENPHTRSAFLATFSR